MRSHDFTIDYGDLPVLAKNTITVRVDFIAREIEITLRDSQCNAVAKELDTFMESLTDLTWTVLGRSELVVRKHLFSGLIVLGLVTQQSAATADIVDLLLTLGYDDRTTFYT